MSPVDAIRQSELHVSRKHNPTKERGKHEKKEAISHIPPPVSNGDTGGDEITDLPNAPALLSRQYSGYLDIRDNTVHMHYWFIESQRDKTKDPLVLW